MLDVKALALKALESAKQNLQRDQNLIPRGIIVTEDETQDSPLEFEGPEEKERVCRELVKTVRQENALAIVTVHDAYWAGDGDWDPDGYYPGKLAVDGSQECIFVTISGPAIETWSIRVPYQRANGVISFGPAEESFGDAVNF
jgi:hypothetical protein